MTSTAAGEHGREAPARERLAGPVRLGIAVGLGVAGWVALVVAWVVDDDLVRPEPGSGWVRALTVLLAVVAVALAWGVRDDSLGRLARSGLVVVALALSVVAGLGFIHQYRHGFPGPAAVLSVVGGVAALVGSVVGLRAHVAAGRRRRVGLCALGAALVVPMVAVPLVAVAPDWRVTATTADPAIAATVPGSVTGPVWSTPLDGRVHDMVAAGDGVVVLLDEGVAALDGVTGQVRWSRLRHGATGRRVTASPDGRTVLLDIGPGGHAEVIDAGTGRLRFTAPARGRASAGPDISVTDTSYIGHDGRFTEFDGYSLTDGHLLWTYRVPPGCVVNTLNYPLPGVSSGWLLPMSCGERRSDSGTGPVFTEFRLVSVDGDSGALRWQHTVPLAPPRSHPDLFGDTIIGMTADRRLVDVDLDLASTADPRIVLDTGSGSPVSVPASTRPRTATIGVTGDHTLIDLATGRALAVSADVLSCMNSRLSAQVESQVVCQHPAADPQRDLQAHGRLDLGIGVLDGTGLRRVTATLGGPFNEKPSLEKVLIVPAPGAVVVAATGLAPTSGQSRVVGLR